MRTFELVTALISSSALLGVALMASGAGAAPASATPTGATKPFVPDGNMDRSAIPAAYKWQLEPLFSDDTVAQKALDAVAKDRAKLATFKGKLKDAKALAECLGLYFDARLQTNKLTLYSNLRFDSDQKNTALQAQSERALQAMSDLMATASFIRQEVLALDDKAMASAYKKVPKLADYRPYLDELRRRRAHVKGAEAELVLAQAGDNLWAEIDLNEIPSDHEKAFQALLTDVPLPKIKDDAGKEVQLTLSNYPKYRSSPDRRVRRDTVESFFAALMQYQHAFAADYAGQVRYSIFLAKARGYATALDAYLHKDNIDPAVYRSLVTSVRANLAPLHRYVALRKKVMKLDELHLYDLYPSMVKSVKMEVPYGEAVRILPEALKPLGDDYLATLRQGLDLQHGWLDLYPHRDKDSGAFSANVYGVHPYIKMNYFNEVDDLSTLAHEYGHAVHSHLSMTHQPYVTASYAPFVAEIASTCNEKLLSDYLVANAKSDDEKLYLLNELLETIRTTIYRQTLFAEMELVAHSEAEQGTPLTAELLNTKYAELVKAYYGPAFTLGQNDAIEWAYIPHLYYKYYVFTYATGLSSGIAIAEKLAAGGAPARDAYLGMLKGGNSKPPLELLRGAGVDLTKPEAVEAAARLFDKTITDMEVIMKRKGVL